MKRARLLRCAVLIVLFCLTLVYSSYGQEKGQDFGALYRNYFKTIIDGNYAGAWDGLTSQSKLAIAKLIANEAKISPEKALQMLNDNEKGVRDGYFKAFRDNIREILNELYNKGIYTVKNITDQYVIVNIEIQKEPKDFKMLKQDGKWKVNFFEDLADNK